MKLSPDSKQGVSSLVHLFKTVAKCYAPEGASGTAGILCQTCGDDKYMYFSYAPQSPPNERVLAPTKPGLGQWEVLGFAYWVYRYYLIGDVPVAYKPENTQDGRMAPLGCF